MVKGIGVAELKRIENPYLRQKGETQRSYHYFRLWCEGEGDDWTSLKEFANKNKVNHQTILGWSSKWEWAYRRRAWIAKRAEEEDQKNRANTRIRLKVHSNAAQAMVEKGVEILKAVTVGGNGRVLNSLVLKAASDTIERGISMERLGLGLPTQITRIEHDLRVQVEQSIIVQSQILAILEVHLCDECRNRVADELETLHNGIEETAESVQRYSGLGSLLLSDPGN